MVNSSLSGYDWLSNAQENTNATELGDVNIHYTEIIFQGFFISQICWVLILWIVKCSILAFYWRLFSTNSLSIRLGVWTITVFVMCWGILVVNSSTLFNEIF